jgi:putative transposase
MTFDPERNHRHSIRLAGYDYSQPGAYFITTVVYHREALLGAIENGKVNLNRCGEIARQAWMDLPGHYPPMQIGEFCVMPTHVHGTIILADSPPGLTQRPLFEIVRAFKSFSSIRINRVRGTPGQPVWQRNYYERIIRNEREFQAICDYIRTNPTHWEEDIENQ